jgi:hypothetical protein
VVSRDAFLSVRHGSSVNGKSPITTKALKGYDFAAPAAPGRPTRAGPPARDHVARDEHHRTFGLKGYSHSMVPGGLLVMSSTTRFTSGTSLVIRLEIRASRSEGSRAQSAVIASSLVTGRSTMGWP